MINWQSGITRRAAQFLGVVSWRDRGHARAEGCGERHGSPLVRGCKYSASRAHDKGIGENCNLLLLQFDGVDAVMHATTAAAAAAPHVSFCFFWLSEAAEAAEGTNRLASRGADVEEAVDGALERAVLLVSGRVLSPSQLQRGKR